MSKEKYRFNVDSMRFDKVQRTIWSKLLVLLRLLLATFALAVLFYIVYSLFFDTPRERQMAQANAQLESQLATLRDQYEQTALAIKDIEQRDAYIYRTIFESEPVASGQQEATQRTMRLYETMQHAGVRTVVNTTSSQLDTIAATTNDLSRSFDAVVEQAQRLGSGGANIPGIRPIRNSRLARIAAPFGVRMHPFYKVLKMHTGVDFTAPIGTPVVATAHGVVEQVVGSKRGYGNTVIINHENGYSTLYAHLDEILVNKGATVAQGTTIGTVGNTGMSMAPHLHYEVQKNDQPIDPLNYFFLDVNPIDLAQMAQMAHQTGQSLD